MKNNKIDKIIIATGGTGGHVIPAYSLAIHFIEKKINVKIISDKRGLRYLKNLNNLEIIQINSATIFDKSIFKFFVSTLIISYSIIRSFIFLLLNRPNIVFGMGGYSSFPVCIAAKILQIPFIIYENNLHIGKANKYLLPLSKKIFVSYLELQGVSKKYRYKVCRIGNIVRKEILNLDKKKNFNHKDKTLKLLILGGSQAAKVFAEKLPQIFEKCKNLGMHLKIYQQCLPEQNEILKSFYKNKNIDCEIFNFANNIFDYFSKVDLAITRSGSSMLAELINANIPFISIPLPTSADNHQLKNAIYYEKNQYSYLIEEKNLSEKLFKLLDLIQKDSSLLEKVRKKQSHYSDKKVYDNIDTEINKMVNEKY